LNGLWDAGLREEGPQTCMRRQINTRATTRSCSNNTFGVMMASPFTTVKGDECTRLTPADIIRCLQVQAPIRLNQCRVRYNRFFLTDLPTADTNMTVRG